MWEYCSQRVLSEATLQELERGETFFVYEGCPCNIDTGSNLRCVPAFSSSSKKTNCRCCEFSRALEKDGDTVKYSVNLFECHRFCECAKKESGDNIKGCSNRETQIHGFLNKPSKNDSTYSYSGCIEEIGQCRLQVFLAGERVGYGLKTCDFIKQGSFVIEYAGEVVTTNELTEIRRARTTSAVNYVLTVNEFTDTSDSPSEDSSDLVPIHKANKNHKFCKSYHVDATEVGNTARFINHSCEPNLDIYNIRRENSIPHLCFFANRDIQPNEELTISYGLSFPSNDDKLIKVSERKRKRSLSIEGQDSEESMTYIGSLTPCFCGTASCKGTLPFDKMAP